MIGLVGQYRLSATLRQHCPYVSQLLGISLPNSFSTLSTHSREDSMGEVTRGKDRRRRRILDLKKSVRPSVRSF